MYNRPTMMRKEKTLLALGVWVAILPFLGFPNFWRDIFFVLTGCLLIYLKYNFDLEDRNWRPKKENDSKTFVDNI
jgi:hypothetical protein